MEQGIENLRQVVGEYYHFSHYEMWDMQEHEESCRLVFILKKAGLKFPGVTTEQKCGGYFRSGTGTMNWLQK